MVTSGGFLQKKFFFFLSGTDKYQQMFINRSTYTSRAERVTKPRAITILGLEMGPV